MKRKTRPIDIVKGAIAGTVVGVVLLAVGTGLGWVILNAYEVL